MVTALAYHTQDEYNKLVEFSSGEDAVKVEERAFIVGELLKLALHLDYADETGRRKMFQLTSVARNHWIREKLITLLRGDDLRREPA